MKKFYAGRIFIILFTLPLAAVCQKSISKTESEKIAKQYKAKYPKEEVVALESSESYTFMPYKGGNEPAVSAVEKGEERYISLKNSTHFTNVIFFDSTSSVEKLKCKTDKSSNEFVLTTTSAYESDGIFYNDVKTFAFTLSFDELGQQKTITYDKEHKDIRYLTRIFFHSFYPVKKKTITIEIPDWLTMELKEINFAGNDIKKKETANPSRKSKTYTYTIEDLPPYKNENLSPNRAFRMPHIIVWSKNFTANGKKNTLFETDADLYKWYASLVKQVNNKSDELKPKVTQLLEGKKTDIEKVKTLFYWVQDNIRYIAFENGIMGFKPEAANNVYKNKYGDCKGKANLLCEMLKLAGFDARLTWLGTNDIPYDFSIPSLCVNNHMICTVVLNGKNYYLDGTEDYISFGDYANRIQGRPVMIEQKDRKTHIIEKVPAFTYERNKKETRVTLTLEGENLVGKVAQKINGEQKTQFMQGYNALRNEHKEDALKSYLNNEDKNYIVSNIVTKNLENRDSLLNISFDFKLQNYLTSVGSEVYVDIDPEKEFSEFEIDSTRINDIEFSHKIFHETTTEFTVPKGYKVDYLPEAVTRQTPDYIINLNYQQKGSKVIYQKKIIFTNGLIPAPSFKDWNDTQKLMHKFYNDKIVLNKG